METRSLDSKIHPRTVWKRVLLTGNYFCLADLQQTQHFNISEFSGTDSFNIKSQAGCSKRLSSKAAGPLVRGADTVVREHDNGPRTPLADFFNILLGAFLSMGGITACVSQEKYEAMVLENHALRQENSVLQSRPAEIPKAQLDLYQEVPARPMNNLELKRLLSKLAGNVGGQEGAWKIDYHGIPMVIITSPPHDRMRIVSPIPNSEATQATEMTELLNANFDRALDARYALYQGRLWSVFLHPLSSLTEAELGSALDQVANLVKTYGTTYSSGHLYFGN